MAGTQDPLTDLPPPSRFDLDELSNFAFHGTSPPPPPPPSISLLDPNAYSDLPLRPPLLLVATSSASFHLYRNLQRKVSIGSLVLPASPTPPPDSASGPQAHSLRSEIVCELYSLHTPGEEGDAGKASAALLLCVPKPVPEERAHGVAKLLLNSIVPERLLVLASVQMENFRGKLSADEHALFKLETERERADRRARGSLSSAQIEEDFPYFPSGSVVSGLTAAILTRCHIRGSKAKALLSWPDSGPSAPSRLIAALKRLPETKSTDFGSSLLVPFRKKSVSDLDIYM